MTDETKLVDSYSYINENIDVFSDSEQDVVENGQQVDSGTQESSTSFYDQPPPLR